jgi:outer membrane lipoprotein-sorting protein
MARDLNRYGSNLSRRAFLAAVMAAAPFAAMAQPATTLERAAQDAADIARIEAYLETVRTLDSRFLQIGPDGSVAEGRFLLSRPGRLRLEYDSPNPNLFVSDGRAFVHIDKRMSTIAYLPIDATPAGVLVRNTIRLSGDVSVAAIERGAAALRVALVQTRDPRAGRLVLTFADKPLALVGWSVVDAQGLTTRLTLVAPKFDVAFGASEFTFFDPKPRGSTDRP